MTLSLPWICPELTRVVVDPIMLERLKLLRSPAPLSEDPYRAPYFINGWPVMLDVNLGDDRGAILHADGRVEKFGKWPTAQVAEENGS